MSKALEAIKEKRGSSNTLSSSASTDAVAKNRAKRKYGSFDNLADEINSSSTALTSALGGWTDAATMASTRDQATRMRDKMAAYKSYSGSTDYDDIISSYEGILGEWDNISGLYGYYQNADAFNAAMEKAKAEVNKPKPISLAEQYAGLRNNADFAEKSTWEPDKRYNNPFMDKQTRAEYANSLDFYNKDYLRSDGVSLYDNLTDEQKATGTYIFNTQGAGAYVDYVMKAQEENSNAWYDENIDRYNAFAKNHNLSASLLEAFVGPLVAPFAFGQTAMSMAAGADESGKAGATGLYRMLESGKATASEAFADKLGNGEFLGMNIPRLGYNALTSGIASRTLQRLFGPVANVVMGMGSFVTTFYDAKESGLSDASAAMKAGVAGLIEFGTEQMGMEWAFGKEGKTWIVRLLKQAGAEGAEEVVGDFLNTLYDVVANGQQNELTQAYNDLIERGYTRDQAAGMVIGSTLANTFEGAFSAALSAGAEGGIQEIRNTKIGNQIDREAYQQAMENIDQESDVYKKYLETWNEYNGDLSTMSANNFGNLVGQTMDDKVADAYNTRIAELDEERVAEREKAEAEAQAEKEKLKAEKHDERISGTMSVADAAAGKYAETAKKMAEKFKVGEESVTETGEKIDLETSTVSMEGGKVIITNEAGEKIDASKATLNIEDAEAVARATEMDVPTQKAYFESMNGNEGYTKAFDTIWAMGMQHAGLEDTIAILDNNAGLSNDEIALIYKQAEAHQKAEAVRNQEAHTEHMKAWKGTFTAGTFDASAIKGVRLGAKEKKLMMVAEAFTAIGINVRVIYDQSSLSKNGLFSEGENLVTINLAARRDKDIKTYGNGSYVVSSLAHEFTHWMEDKMGEEFELYKGIIREGMGEKAWQDQIDSEQMKFEKNHPGEKLSAKAAESEVIARASENMLKDTAIFEKYFGNTSTDVLARIRDAIQKFIKQVSDFFNKFMADYQESTVEAAQLIKENADAYKAACDMWLEMFDRAIKLNEIRNQETIDNAANAINENDKAAEAEFMEATETTTLSSTKLDDELGANALKLVNSPITNKKGGIIKGKNYHVEFNAEQKAKFVNALAMRKLVAAYLKMLDKYMPEDIEGDIVVSNASYSKSVEHALICVRSLVARWFADEVSESLGRPLTENEQIIASQILAGKTGNQRECLYCYVASDRASYRAAFGAYFLRYASVSQAAAANKEAYKAEIDFLQSAEGKQHLEENTNKDRIFGKKYDGPLKNFAEFLGPSAATPNQIERYINFVKDGLNGEVNLDASDLTTKTKRAGLIKAGGKKGWFVNDADEYSKSAAWPKNTDRKIKLADGREVSLEYIAYNGSILKMNKKAVDALNSDFGLRLYSDSDYVPHFILEDMQVICDAAVKGLKMLAYTKDVMFAKVFAQTGIAINISTYGNLSKNAKNDEHLNALRAQYKQTNSDADRQAYLKALSKYVEYDEMQGATWKEAQELRKKYDNVGTVFVANNDDMVEWAMAQDWIDVVIPYHLVRAGQAIAAWHGYTNYKGAQEDRKMSDWKSSYKKSIPPTIHKNSRELYDAALKENHLTHRFAQWKDNPNYMKLVNETRLPYDQIHPVVAEFGEFDEEGNLPDDIQHEIDRIKTEGAYGYGQGINSLEEQNRLFADEIKESVRAIKAFAAGEITGEEYGRVLESSKEDDEYMSAVKTGNTAKAQEMVDAAAKRAGYTIRAYHGTNAEFNVFSYEKLGSKNFMASSAHMGFFAAKSKETAESYIGLNSMDLASLYLNSEAQENMEALKKEYGWEARKAKDDEARDKFFEEYKMSHGYKEEVLDMLDHLRENLSLLFKDDEVSKKEEFMESMKSSFTYRWNEKHINDMYDAWEQSSERKEFKEFEAKISEEWEQMEIKRKGYVPNVKNLYIKMEKPFIYDFKGEGRDTESFAARMAKAKEEGYDGCIFLNVADGADIDDIYTVFTNTQLKSADAVTYDDNGNVVPLSQRFNEGSEDIRYSDKEDSEGNKLSEGQEKYFANSKIRDALGRLIKVYHGSDEYGFTIFDTLSPTEYGSHFGTKAAAARFDESGEKTYEGYLNIENPLRMPDIFGNVFKLSDYVNTIYGKRDQLIDGKLLNGTTREEIKIINNKQQLPYNDAFKEYTQAAQDLAYDDIGDEILVAELAQNYLKSCGYDGIIYENAFEDKGNDSYIIFDSEQFKRADNLNPTKDRDMRYSDKLDEEYEEAYFNGDDERMEELVEEAANKAGYKYKAFHHTEAAFTVFDLGKARKNMDIQGFFFSADKDAESEYGSVRYDVFLKMKKPYIIDSKEKAEAIPVKFGTENYGVKVREWLQSQGYDSVIRKAEYYGAAADEYIVFSSNQIKSAEVITYAGEDEDADYIPLSERFNSRKKDIRYSDKEGYVNYHNKKTGPYEVKIKADVTKYLLKFAFSMDRQEYVILNSAVLENNDGHLNKNTIGIETTANFIYIYVTDKDAMIHAIYKERLNYDDLSARDFDEKLIEAISSEWDVSEGSLFGVSPFSKSREYRGIADAVRKIAKDKQRDYLSSDISGGKKTSDRLYSDKLDGYTEVVPGRLGLTDERIEELLSGSWYGSTNKDYAQAYIAYVSPDDFLKLTTGFGQRALERIKTWGSGEWEVTDFEFDKFADTYNRVPIQLKIDEEENEVYGHEGRHRMWQLKQMGYNQVPVLIFNPDNKYNKKPIRSIDLMPQWFNEQDNYFDNSDRITLRYLLPFSQGYKEQIKQMFGSGSKSQTLFSDKEDDTRDILGQNKRLTAENEKLKDDIKRLAKKLKLEKTITNGKAVDRDYIEKMARNIVKDANSKISYKEVADDIEDIFNYIVNTKEEPEVILRNTMDELYFLAQKLADKPNQKGTFNKRIALIRRDIKSYKIKLSKAQKIAMQATHGMDYEKEFAGKIAFSDDGQSIDEVWAELSKKYPDIFKEAATTEKAAKKDAIGKAVKLAQIYDDLGDLMREVDRFENEEAIRAFAIDLYNKFWSIPSAVTTADKYAEEIKRLKFEHRKAIDEVKESSRKALDDLRLANEMHYGAENSRMANYYRSKISQIRAEKNAKYDALRQHHAEQLVSQRERAARKAAIDKIMGVSKTLRTWLDKNTAKEHVPDVLKGPVYNLLDAIDFSSRQSLGLVNGKNSGKDTAKDVSIKNAMKRIARLVGAVQDGMVAEKDASELNEFVDFPPGFKGDVEEIYDTVDKIADMVGDQSFVLQEMNSEQLDKLYKMLNIMKAVVTQMNKLISKSNAHSVDYYAQQTIMESRSLGAKRANAFFTRMAELSEGLPKPIAVAGTFVADMGNKAVDAATKYIAWTNVLPYYAFKHMGKAAMSMFENIQDGWDKFAFNIKAIKEFAEGAWNSEDYKRLTEDVHEFELIVVPTDAEIKKGGEPHVEKVKMTAAQMMSIYCLSKRDQAKGHFAGKGIRIEAFKDGVTEVNQTRNVRISESSLQAIISELQQIPKAIEIADAIQGFMNGQCSDWGNEITMRRWGIKGFTEKNYFPIKVDKNSLAVEPRDNESSIYRLLNLSFTKPLAKHATATMEISSIFDTFSAHTSDMAKYNALALPVLDLLKWYNYKETDASANETKLKAELEQTFGKESKEYIIHFLQDLNGTQEAGRNEKWSKKMVRSYKTAAVAANLQVALLQPISILRAMVVMDKKYLMAGIGGKEKIKHGREMLAKYSGISVWKDMNLFDTNVSRGLDAMIKQSDTKLDQVIEVSMKGAEWGDKITWAAMWNACEAELRDQKPELTGEDFYKAVAKRFREIVYTTQVVDSTMTRTDMMRSSNLWIQTLTAFMSEPSVSLNVLSDVLADIDQYARKTGDKKLAVKKYGKAFARATEAFLLSAAVEAIIRGLIGGARNYGGDDDDDKLIEKMWAEFISNANILNNIPIAKDVVSIFEGYNVKRMDMDAAQNAYYAMKGWGKVIEGGDLTYKTVYRTALTLSQATGIPMSSALRVVKTSWNNTVGRFINPDLNWK